MGRIPAGLQALHLLLPPIAAMLNDPLRLSRSASTNTFLGSRCVRVYAGGGRRMRVYAGGGLVMAAASTTLVSSEGLVT